MKTTMKAAILLLSTTIFFSQASLAGKPDRNPSEKDCDFAAMSVCAVALGNAYDLVGYLLSNNGVVETFMSRNPDQDAGSLQCKISGADIKVAQDKADEAAYLMDMAVEKIWSLYSQGKLSWEGLDMMLESFATAKNCIPTP